jgi:manganese/zinc/iron transport system ATP- binding protein
MQGSALKVEQLNVNYGKRAALWDVSFDLPQGTLAAIIGPNGAGKSTLIKAALGLIDRSGKVEVFGQPLKQVFQKVAYVPQRASVDWDFPLTVTDLVLMGRYGRLGLFKRPKAADRAAAEHCLELVGMAAYRDRQISQLSGGQQQRVFIARAFTQEADLYFMDEPFSAVDLGTESILIQLLQDLKKKGKTVIVVHHDLESIKKYFEWAILLNVRLIASGSVEQVLTPAHLHAAYGQSYALFEEALKISQEQQTGIK